MNKFLFPEGKSVVGSKVAVLAIQSIIKECQKNRKNIENPSWKLFKEDEVGRKVGFSKSRPSPN